MKGVSKGLRRAMSARGGGHILQIWSETFNLTRAGLNWLQKTFQPIARPKFAERFWRTLSRKLEDGGGSASVKVPGPRAPLSKKNVGFYARHFISRTESRKNVGQFSVNFLESDKMLGYWLSFYANRLERTRFVILAELSPKKTTLISILIPTVLDLKLFNRKYSQPSWRKRLRRLKIRIQR